MWYYCKSARKLSLSVGLIIKNSSFAYRSCPHVFKVLHLKLSAFRWNRLFWNVKCQTSYFPYSSIGEIHVLNMCASDKVRKCGETAGFEWECDNCLPLAEMVILTGLCCHLPLKMPERKKLLESKCKGWDKYISHWYR